MATTNLKSNPTKASSLHDALADIVEEYLGPAGERFLDRQIKFHLKKPAQSVTAEDVETLREWIKVSLALLTNNKKLVDECDIRISKLSNG